MQIFILGLRHYPSRARDRKQEIAWSSANFIFRQTHGVPRSGPDEHNEHGDLGK